MPSLISRLAGCAACCVALSLPAAGQQTIHSVYRNNTSVRGLIQSVERESNSFRDSFERRYNTGFQPNWKRSDRSLKAIQALDRSLEIVEHRNASGEKPKYFRDDVYKVALRARELDRMFRNADEVLDSVRPQWRHLRTSIDTLAAVYDFPDAGGWGNLPPSTRFATMPARSRQPSRKTRPQVHLTVNSRA